MVPNSSRSKVVFVAAAETWTSEALTTSRAHRSNSDSSGRPMFSFSEAHALNANVIGLIGIAPSSTTFWFHRVLDVNVASIPN